MSSLERPDAALPFRVTTCEDGLAAYLEVRNAPSPDGRPGPTVDLAAALAYLAEAGITYGVDVEHVEWALEERDIPVLVAQGQPAREGTSGEVEIMPELLELGGRPKLKADGSVDLFDLNLVRNVRAGTVLAKRTPPSPGVPGLSVRGQLIEPPAVKPVPLPRGEGTRLSEDGLELLAAVDGHAVVVGSSVSVASVYRTRGDVGVATGHITFVGSVVIAGDINPGFRVHADGDVEVQGTVNGGQIEAGGNVSVRYGIKHHARVVASGSIKAKFVEFSEVKAGAQVWVSDGIVQSNVEAGGRVEVLGRNGSIVGGHVVARFGVSARELGSVRGVPTCIEVGVAPELEGMLQRLSDEALALGRQAELYRARLRYLAQQSSAGHLTQYGAKEVRKLLAELQDTTMQQARIAGRQQALGETQLAILRAEVEAHDRCHADVQIRVGSGQCAVSKTRRRVRFRRSERAHEVDAVSI